MIVYALVQLTSLPKICICGDAPEDAALLLSALENQQTTVVPCQGERYRFLFRWFAPFYFLWHVYFAPRKVALHPTGPAPFFLSELQIKMVHYYSFLSNRKRGELLPMVYEALDMRVRERPEQPDFNAQMKEFLRTAPYKCILCDNWLLFSSAAGWQTRHGVSGG